MGDGLSVCLCRPLNMASRRNVGLLGSKSGLGSTGGVCREGLLEGTCLSERDRKGRGPAPARGFQEGKPDIGTCQRYLPLPAPTLSLLAPEGCWQLDRQTDSAHIGLAHRHRAQM